MLKRLMAGFVWLVVVGGMGVKEASAEPTVLKCLDAKGSKVSDLVVDLSANKMRWGTALKYNIKGLTDRYISAYQQEHPASVGGETWVLDRITGEYLRGSVYIACLIFDPDRPAKCLSKKLVSKTFRGRCGKKML